MNKYCAMYHRFEKPSEKEIARIYAVSEKVKDMGGQFYCVHFTSESDVTRNSLKLSSGWSVIKLDN